MKFIIIHGSFGSPDEHWFPPLKEALEYIGHEVLVPKLPCDEWDDVTKAGINAPSVKQNLESWFAVLDPIVTSFTKKEKICFIGHSLGPVFILHLVEKYKIFLDSAIFVSPFLDSLNKIWQADTVNTSFYKTDFDFIKLKKLIPMSYVLYSDNDPYVAMNISSTFADMMESEKILVTGASHINDKGNYSLIFELCKTRIPYESKK